MFIPFIFALVSAADIRFLEAQIREVPLMMKFKIASARPTPVLLVFIAGLVFPSQGQIPQLLHYQGRVAVGCPPVNFDASGLFKSALWDGPGKDFSGRNSRGKLCGGSQSAIKNSSAKKPWHSGLAGYVPFSFKFTKPVFSPFPAEPKLPSV